MALSHAFPIVNVYGQALHPNVVAASYKSLLYQNLNWEHIMVAYNPDQHQQDKILGSVVAVNFPDPPVAGWRVGSKDKAPRIEAVATFAKLARGMQTMIGRHKTGRHKFAVSMEVQYPYAQCAFTVALNGAKPTHETPEDMVQAGWEYIPWTEADDKLLACFSVKKNRIVSEHKGRQVVQLMGGLNNPVHYSGVAVVHYGAEREAHILQMAASNTNEHVQAIIEPLRRLAGLAKVRRGSKMSSSLGLSSECVGARMRSGCAIRLLA
jgi:hypothetical protein